MPKSKISILFIGVLIADRLYFSKNGLDQILLSFLCIISVGYAFYHNKLRIYVIGFLVFFVVDLLNTKMEEDFLQKTVNEKRFSEMKEKNISLRIVPGDEIKKSFRSSEVFWNGNVFQAVTRHYGRSEKIFVYDCMPESVRIKKMAIDGNEYLNFLKKYGGVTLSFAPDKCIKVTPVENVRDMVKLKISELIIRGGMKDVSYDISMGLIFGDSSYLSNEFKLRAKEGGILHIFAASGLHISIITACLFFLFEKIPFFGYYSIRILPVFITFFYLYLLGFPVSLTRAWIFSALYYSAALLFRNFEKADLLILSAGLICLFDKHNLFTLSFNLSFLAVVGIFYLKPLMDNLLFHKIKNPVTENITVSLAASFATFPILILYFNSYSYGSVLVNFFLVPITSAVMPVLYSAVLAEGCGIIFIREILWALSDLMLRVSALLSEVLGKSIGYYIEYAEKINELYYMFSLCIIVLILIFFIKYKFQKINKNELSWYFSFSTSAISLALIGGFLYGGYTIFPAKDKEKRQWETRGKYFSANRNENTVEIRGYCGRNEYQLSKNSRESCSNVNSIKIEKESCLKYAVLCNPQAEITVMDNRLLSWKDVFNLKLDETGNKNKNYTFQNFKKQRFKKYPNRKYYRKNPYWKKY